MIFLKEIIDVINPYKVIGNQDIKIEKPIKLDDENTDPNVIMWANSKNYNSLKEVSCGVLICDKINNEDISHKCTYLLVENPRMAFLQLLSRFFQSPILHSISSSAIISDSAKLGENVHIGENVVIEENCSIGDNTKIDHNTIIKKDSIIAKNVIIGSNTVIGGIGFGYEKNKNDVYISIPHIGNVKIEDGVEIGNNTTIDRAVLGSTTICKNVKIDNLVHIAHGAKIGENSLIIAKTMIAGSVIIGKNVWISPSSSILNNLKIGDNSTIGMGAVVISSVKENEIIIGNPGRKLIK